MKILFVCPILDIRYEWFTAFVEVWEQLRKKSGVQVGRFMPYRKPVHLADTLAVKEAFKGGFDYILRMDDDVWDIPPNAVDMLLAADKDFISAVMYANSFPYQMCAFTNKDKTKTLIDVAKGNADTLYEVEGEGVQPVDLTAFPFTLWKVSMFTKIPEPWFVYDEGVPSDSYFCQKCLDNGVQPFVHKDIQVTHRGVTYWNRLYSFIADAKIMIQTGKIKKGEPLYTAFIEIQKNIEQLQKLEV
jgi:hypothetical protein